MARRDAREGRVRIDGLDVAYYELGTGPLALCLHGFPDSAHTWRHLLPELAEAGYRAVAPFMRGYGPTGPAADGAYQTGALAADACAIHEALGAGENAVIIGHDWGAPAAYGAAVHEPHRWSKVVGLAVPPGGRVGAAFADYEQLRRSSYMFIFQHPMAEGFVEADDFHFIERIWEDWSPGYDATDDLEHVKAALGSAGRLSAALGYYRAALQPDLLQTRYEPWQAAVAAPPPQPLLYLHGEDDGCIGAEVADGMEHECDRFELIADAGHFLHLERPDLVNRIIVDWLNP